MSGEYVTEMGLSYTWCKMIGFTMIIVDLISFIFVIASLFWKKNRRKKKNKEKEQIQKKRKSFLPCFILPFIIVQDTSSHYPNLDIVKANIKQEAQV